MLRDFGLPTFRKDIQREISQTKQAPPISFGLTGSTIEQCGASD